MVKKLDILILRSFVGPFLATFLIALFVLTMQFFWLYIDDLVGKGLDLSTLAYLTGLVAVTWVPLALPLALLLSSIMTFGNLGETFELVSPDKRWRLLCEQVINTLTTFVLIELRYHIILQLELPNATVTRLLLVWKWK